MALPEDVLTADFAEAYQYLPDEVAYRDYLMSTYEPHFYANDADATGTLNRDEYGGFENAVYEERVTKYGGFFEWSAEELDLWYNAASKLDGEEELSLADIKRQVEVVAMISEEMSMEAEDDWYYYYWDYYYWSDEMGGMSASIELHMYDAATVIKTITSVTLLGASIYSAF